MTHHGIDNPIQHFTDDSCTCPSCGATFSYRSLVVKHAAEKRIRSKNPNAIRCRDVILSGKVPVINIEIVNALRARDKVDLAEAEKLGHNHVIATKRASSVIKGVKRTAKIALLVPLAPLRRIRHKTSYDNIVAYHKIASNT